MNERRDTVMERSWASGTLDHRGAVEEILRIGPGLVSGMVIQAVGHRVVHGGMVLAVPTRLDPQVMEDLRALVPLAPLHQPHNLAPIPIIAAAVPRLPQVACFDTAFHRSQPPLAQSFALPRKLSEAGVRRYGFHGLSYGSTSRPGCARSIRLAVGRVIVALGSGASLCAGGTQHHQHHGLHRRRRADDGDARGALDPA